MSAFLSLYPLTFPEASIDFCIRPCEALEVEVQALKHLGVPNPSGYLAAVDFSWDETTKRYLEGIFTSEGGLSL